MHNATPDNTSSATARTEQLAQIDADSEVVWLDEATKGLAQVADGHTSDARENLAAQQKRRADEGRAFEQSCLSRTSRLNGWKFNREEANARR